MRSPCYQCLNRQMYCHTTCEKYKEYRKEMDKQIQIRMERNLLWNPNLKKKRRK